MALEMTLRGPVKPLALLAQMVKPAMVQIEYGVVFIPAASRHGLAVVFRSLGCDAVRQAKIVSGKKCVQQCFDFKITVQIPVDGVNPPPLSMIP